MTIVTAFMQRDRAYILTDMAMTNEDDGRLSMIDSKFVVGSSFPWGIAVSGNLNPHALVRQLERLNPRNPRSLVRSMTTALEQMTEDAIREGNRRPSCALWAAMWSARSKRPVIACMDNNGDQFAPLVPPFTFVEPEWIMSGVGTPETMMGRPVNLCDPASFDPAADGIALIQAQRIANVWQTAAGPCYRIGGGAQLLTASRQGVAIETIHTWPDKVGFPINPSFS